MSDYCKLINEEDGHMGDTRVGVRRRGLRTQGEGEGPQCQPNIEGARRDVWIHNSCQKKGKSDIICVRQEGRMSSMMSATNRLKS